MPAQRHSRREKPDAARQRRLEAEVKRILTERHPEEVLQAIREHMDEIPRDEVAFQKELLDLAAVRLAEMKRGKNG